MKLWYLFCLLRERREDQYVSGEWLADRSRWENRQGVDGPRWVWPLTR